MSDIESTKRVRVRQEIAEPRFHKSAVISAFSHHGGGEVLRGSVDVVDLAMYVREWQDRNFGEQSDGRGFVKRRAMDKLDGAAVVCEEAGEVMRAALKERMGIRPETRGSLAEEIPDLIFAALALADREGLDINACLRDRFIRLLSLDFTKDVEGGVGRDG